MNAFLASVDTVLWTHCRWFNSHEPQPDPEAFSPLVSSTGSPGTACLACGEALTAADPTTLTWRHRRSEEPHPAVLMAGTFQAQHGAQKLPAGLCATCGEPLWADPYGKTEVPAAAPEGSPVTLEELLKAYWSALSPFTGPLATAFWIFVAVSLVLALVALGLEG